MNLLIRWLASALVIFATAYAFPAIKITDFKTAVIAAVVLGLINLIIRPVVKLFTLPINILTLGLFTLVINAAMIMLADYFVDGFKVSTFWWALLLGAILSVVNIILKKEEK